MRYSIAYFLETVAKAIVLLPIFGAFDHGLYNWFYEKTAYGTHMSVIRSFAPFFMFAAAYAKRARLNYPYIFHQHSPAWCRRMRLQTYLDLTYTFLFFCIAGMKWSLVYTCSGLVVAATCGLILGLGDGWHHDQKQYRRMAAKVRRGAGIELQLEIPGTRTPTVLMYRSGTVLIRRPR